MPTDLSGLEDEFRKALEEAYGKSAHKIEIHQPDGIEWTPIEESVKIPENVEPDWR